MPGEFDFVRWLETQPVASPRVRLGIGDDLAVLCWPADDLLLVGVDQVLDGIHFDSAVHGPRAIGRKAMNRNLSDCAAMACRPAAAVCTVALPAGCGEAYARELYAGLREAADPFDCPVVGGDTGSWPGKLAVTVTILGRSAGVDPIPRTGARPGDGLYVTGPLGGSLAGRHMTFEPRVALARQLAAAGGVTAMLDVSDGLSRDVRHLCRGVGVTVDGRAVPVHADVTATDFRRRLDHALHDGEDHELLFTASRPPPAGVRIGTVTADPAVLLDVDGVREPLSTKGWQHAM